MSEHEHIESIHAIINIQKIQLEESKCQYTKSHPLQDK